SEHSTVTYTSVSIPVEDDSDNGSPGVDGPSIMPEDPYAYIMAAYQEDEILPAEEQPLPAAASPTADSPGYVPESDPEEEPEEDDEDPEEDPADYPADRDDDDDDEEEEEEEPSGDDANDEDEDEDEDEEEEEEHPAPADSVPPVHRMTARISIRDEPSISLPPREEVERLLALTTPPPSPLTPLSSPLPQIPSPPLPASPPASVLPASPLPTSSPPLQLLSSDHRTDRPEITLPPWKRLGIDLGPRYEIGESSAVATTRPIRGRRADYGFVGTMDTEIRRQRAEKVGYGIRDVWVDPKEAVEEVAPMTLEGVNARVTELTAVQEQDTQDIYDVIEDTQDRQTQIYQSVETLFDDSQYHYKTARLLDQEALQAVISQLQAIDRKSQVMTLEMIQADYQRQVYLLSIMGYSQLADCIDLLFCLATQYRSFVQKMAPKRKTTRLNPDATPTPVTDTHTTTSVTNAQIQAMINEGVTAALAARDATRNGDDSHTSGTGARRPVQVARECTYPDFLKCQPLNFKGTEGVVGLT
ncbi:hypothetical protein Tco_0918453, partial [Tanacetum coccineum]